MQKNWMIVAREKLKFAPWNYKLDNEETKQKLEILKRSIQNNGLCENLIIRELPKGMYEVCNGNHRLRAMDDLEITEAMAYNLGKISVKEAQRKTLETNEIKFPIDNLKLGQIFKNLGEEWSFEDLALSIDIPELDMKNFALLQDHDWAQYNAAPPIYARGEFQEIKLNLPNDVARLFMAQIHRVQLLITPAASDNSSYSAAIEAITQIVAQTPDNYFSG
jgi:hypothetical protein